jgi:hypothetical protein
VEELRITTNHVSQDSWFHSDNKLGSPLKETGLLMALQRYLYLYIRCNGNDAELFLIIKMTIQPCNVTPERGMYGKSETVYYRWGLPAGRGFLPGASFNYRPTD